MKASRLLLLLSAFQLFSISAFPQRLIQNAQLSGASNQVKASATLTVLSGGTLAIASGGALTVADGLPLASGGTGASLSDPGADRLLFWDDSAGTITWLTAGTGLTLSGTTLSADVPLDADFITGTANATLTGEQALGSLTTGLLLNTVSTGTGTLSTATAGTDYVAPGDVTANGITMATARLLGRTTASTGAIEEITVGDGLTLTGGALAWDNPMTTSQDIIVGGASGALGRLGVGSDGQVLKVSSGTIGWGTDATGSGTLPGTPSTGDLAYYNGSAWVSLALGTAGQVLTVNSTPDAPEWAAPDTSVTLPGSSTDNALARWSGTGGDTLENSAILANDDGDLLINASATAGSEVLRVRGTADTGARFDRVSAITSGVSASLLLVHESTGDMTDGFGANMGFTIRDTAGVDNTIGSFSVVRDGADNTGQFKVRLATAGSFADALIVNADGTIEVNGIVVATQTPASASATGTAGTIAWDASYIYICTATDTWKRVAIATW